MKKKILVIICLFLSLFLFTACTDKKEDKKIVKKESVETEKDKYIKYVKELKKINESSEDLPFNVEVIYDKIQDEIRYQVIIDNQTSEIKDITALAIHDMHTDDIFPSIGIFDEKVNLTLDDSTKGVILVGYIPFDKDIEELKIQVKVLISYKIDDKEYKSYYVTKK